MTNEYKLTVVFSNAKGAVTDFGREQCSADGSIVIPRYGVWQNTERKSEVVFTSNDLEECKAKLAS